ncbi:MAG: hypothetical protein IKQ10_05125 [Oscillospiraceae bacterium]|nr:hypothetical protein [Oscillospiraceae bacterium]
MVKLEIELSDIDYEAMINEYLPKMQDKLEQSGSPLASLLGGGLASSLLLRSSPAMKDRMAAELINMNASRLEAKLEEMAARNGIPGKVRNLKATAITR